MLRAFVDDPVGDASLRKQLIAARFDLIRSSQYAVAPASEKLLYVDPIAVEAEEGVFPQGDDWWQAHPLFKQYIPGTRDRLEAVMGVRIPLVRVRSNNTTLPAGAYIFMIPPEETQSLLSAVRDAVGEHDQNALAIIAGDETIRPFVRRLIELEFPTVHVLSQREQRPEFREKLSGVIEYEP